MEESSLKNKFINAAKWSTITEIAAKLVSPITNMILARIISPEAFGVVATITMIMSFTDMFTDAGFQKYLVQHEFKDEHEIYRNSNVAFWTNLIIAILLWGAILIFREKISILVGNPGLGNVIAIASIQLLLTPFSSIQMALYRRSFDFKTLFWVRIISVFLPFLVTIPLAFGGLNYWALVIGNIVTQLSNAFILTIKSKWKPKLFYKFGILKEMISFSIWSLIESISIWFTSWMDIFIIGSALNEYYLGIYKTSTTMVNSIMSLITASIIPVLFSTLSRLQNDTKKFNETYFSAQRLVSIFTFPIGIGIYLYSDIATNILLGSKWVDAQRVIGIWALTSSIMIVFGNFSSEVYRAKGKPKLSFIAQVLHLIVLIPVCIIASKYGFEILVYSRAWIRIEFVIVHFILMKLIIGISIKKTFKNVMPTLIASIFMGILGYLLRLIDKSIVWSLISIIICSISYFGVLYLFTDISKDINLVMKKLKVKLLKK